jgi:hypothetical protein
MSLVATVYGEDDTVLHTIFDLEEWGKRFTHNSAHEKSYGLVPAISPCQFVAIERLRRELGDGSDHLATVGTDVFALALGCAARRDLTQIGGLPYWPANHPWPCDEKGAPLMFLAQFSFQDSFELTGPLPGDLLLVFVPNLGAHEGPPEWPHYEWISVTQEPLVGNVDASHLLPARLWMHGTLHRTVDFVDPELCLRQWKTSSFARVLWTDDDLTAACRLDAVKIGGLPSSFVFQHRGDTLESGAQFLAAIPSVCPVVDLEYPFINRRSPIPLHEAMSASASSLLWFDGGTLNFFIELDGTVTLRVDLY